MAASRRAFRLRRCRGRREAACARHPSLPTLVSSHLCTQPDTKTNGDKLASSADKSTELSSSVSAPMPPITRQKTSPPTDLSYFNNQQPLVISSDPERGAREQESPSSPPSLASLCVSERTQSAGRCGGCFAEMCYSHQTGTSKESACCFTAAAAPRGIPASCRQALYLFLCQFVFLPTSWHHLPHNSHPRLFLSSWPHMSHADCVLHGPELSE